MTAGKMAPTIRERLLNRRTLIQASGGTALAAVALGERFFARPHFTTAQAISPIAVDVHQRGTDFARGDMPAGGGFSAASEERAAGCGTSRSAATRSRSPAFMAVVTSALMRSAICNTSSVRPPAAADPGLAARILGR